MNERGIGEHDLLSLLRPDTLTGALVYLVIFIILAMTLSRALRGALHASTLRAAHIDRTMISFLEQMATAIIWLALLILYEYLIPWLRSIGTALLAGVSVASVVIGLAAQSTLGNLVAGISIAIYRPFRLGDVLQVAASQVTINVNSDAATVRWPLTITIRIGRDADLEAAREFTVVAAKETVEPRAVLGCVLSEFAEAHLSPRCDTPTFT